MSDAKQCLQPELRNCYCSLWIKSPEILEAKNLPWGYCGECDECGKPGHLRHAPAAPYTMAWCDECYAKVDAIYSGLNFYQYLDMLDAKAKENPSEK